MERATKTRFSFQSEGETLAGNLFLPERAKPAGVVVAVGPLTSVKEQAAGTYAQAMAERGYAGLAFDYRYFGESAGQPRQFESPEANIEDIKNAATALLADDRLTDLPLFGLGVCFGAGPMVRSVAEDRRFRAFAGVAGVFTDNAKTMARMGAAYQATIDRGRAAERQWRETGEAETIPAVARRRRRCRDAASGGIRVLRDASRPGAQLRERLRGAVARPQPAVRRAWSSGRDRGTGADRPLGKGVGSRSRPRLLLGCEVAQARALARVTRADRLLRRPEAHHRRQQMPSPRSCAERSGNAQADQVRR